MEGADGADADDDCDAEAMLGMEGADGITEDACGSEGALGMDGMPCANAVPANANVTAPRANRAGSAFAIIAHTPGRGSILLQAGGSGKIQMAPRENRRAGNPDHALGRRFDNPPNPPGRRSNDTTSRVLPPTCAALAANVGDQAISRRDATNRASSAIRARPARR